MVPVTAELDMLKLGLADVLEVEEMPLLLPLLGMLMPAAVVALFCTVALVVMVPLIAVISPVGKTLVNESVPLVVILPLRRVELLIGTTPLVDEVIALSEMMVLT